MTVLRLAIMISCSCRRSPSVRPRRTNKDKVSNDNPARPLQMPPASTEVKEAIDDFDRFQRRGAWERASKALYTIPEDQALRFVDGENGFIIPVARKRRPILPALLAERPGGLSVVLRRRGEEAVRRGRRRRRELKNLERIYSAYFITSVGDNAADRLGDLYFELGRFDRAADCWLAILRERPDTDLSPALLSVKAALALASRGASVRVRAGPRPSWRDRYGDEKVDPGRPDGAGRPSCSAASSATSIAACRAGEAGIAAPPRPGPDLTGPVDPAWQLRFADSVEAGMTPAELTQWEIQPPERRRAGRRRSTGTTLFANYLGLHLRPGPEERQDALAVRVVPQSRGAGDAAAAQMHRPDAGSRSSPRAIIVWCLGRDLKDQNFFAPFQLTCRRADNGEVVWKSADLPDYAPYRPGRPAAPGRRQALHRRPRPRPNPQQQQGLPQQFVLAIQPHDGKVLWKTEVGTFRQGQQMYFY